MTLSTVEILERLVGCPTVSRDSNLPLIDWVRNFLADHGVDSQLVPDPTGQKSNLFASVGPAEEGGIVLSGHTDVVPIDGQAWNSDPFTLTRRGSRLHGRGSCDMKGFIAAALSRVPTLQANKLSRPVHLMFSCDEEIGCVGAPAMIAAAKKALPTPAAVIVGEPTSMRIADAHKGICTLQTRVTGIEAHSSLTHQGISAVMLAGELIARLGEISRDVAAKAMAVRHASPEAQAMRGFEPPYTTFGVNRIEGGTAINILAAVCEFGWDIRAIPGDTPAAIVELLSSYSNARLAELAKEGKHCTIQTRITAEVPPLVADGGSAAALARTAAQSTEETIKVPFATEAGQFQQAGWSTVVCGPGSIEQAHKPDEFIELSQLAACEQFLDRAIARQCR